MLNLRLPALVTVKAYGRGAGKTYEGTRWALDRVLNAADVRVAVIGNDSDRYDFLRQFIDAADTNGIPVKYFASRCTAYLENGSSIVFHDIDNPDALRGPQYTYIVGENVGAWPEETYQNAKSACRSGSQERAAMFLTFVGTKSPRILEVLESGFEATTR